MVAFGSFADICQTAALVICPLVESEQGVEPVCYSRNVEIAKTLLFQPGECPAINIPIRQGAWVCREESLNEATGAFEDRKG